MKFGQLIEYNMINIFLEKSYTTGLTELLEMLSVMKIFVTDLSFSNLILGVEGRKFLF